MLTDLQARCVRLRDAMTGQSSASSPDSGDERDLRGKHSRIPIVLFAVAITFYCVYLALVQSSWVLGGGMWAEMASNYYPNSISDSLWTRLFATDFGYVPLPQRLIGIVGSSFNLPAAAIPYFYTWSAVILTGAMVGSFCLRPFRVLVQSDALRFVAVLAVILVADFQTRTYINFTYFGAFFIAIIVALAFVDRLNDPPWYAWFTPLLMISKPSMFVLLPLILITAVVSRSRFRWIALASTLAVFVQACSLLVNKSSVPSNSSQPFSMVEKLHAGVDYSLGYLGGVFIGRADAIAPMLVGVLLLLVCVATVWRFPSRASVLVLWGASLAVLNTVFNSILLSDQWNMSIDRLAVHQLAIDRNVMLTYFGVVLIVVGLLATWVERVGTPNTLRVAVVAPAAFVSWFVVSGWAVAAASMNELPPSPILGNSQWERMSAAIDSDVPVCVPVDPMGWALPNGELSPLDWMFSRDCRVLKIAGPATMLPPVAGAPNKYVVQAPEAGPNTQLVSLAVVVDSGFNLRSNVTTTATLQLHRGGSRTFASTEVLEPGPRRILMSGSVPIPIRDIRSVTIEIASPAGVYRSAGNPGMPAVIWMVER